MFLLRLLLSVLIIFLFSQCRKPVTKTQTITDSSEVFIPRDTSVTVKGSQITDNYNIDSLLTMQEGKIFKKFDSLNRAYLSIVRNGKSIQLECNCPDTTARIEWKERHTKKTITINNDTVYTKKVIPVWALVVGGTLLGIIFVLGIIVTIAYKNR